MMALQFAGVAVLVALIGWGYQYVKCMYRERYIDGYLDALDDIEEAQGEKPVNRIPSP